MIHLTVPHGIEQYNGGAWGTRDVTQGSVEMLLALGRHESCREIILLTYRHQFIGENNWPQWFMTDPFGWIQQAHCHGDIPLWPLKALCDYIEASGDFAILDEQVAWTQPGSAQTTKETSPLIEHVTANIAWLRDHCVPGTALLRYGDGDWNDSLQPAKPEFRERLVSSWTVALCYQVLRRLEELSRQSGREFAGLDSFADAVKADCHRHLMIDGTICGFFLFDENSASSGQPLLHPNDKLTGIHHSLIPMTRSMLGGLFSNVEAEHHLSLIEEHLLAADGARLMDRPPAYRGGICEIFQRAELSSCFSREIGIFYTHAHLRFIETMAHLGKADEMLTAFGMVNPADLKSSVSNALPRQANAYFSSSDADVASRYEAAERYKEIVSGKIGVHGGWRIYSSGPGIFLSLVLTRMLGIRRHYGHIIVDPVLPRELNGLEATIPWENHWLNVRFEVRNATHTPSKVSLNGSELKPTKITDNPYRQGGWMIDAATFSKHLEAEHNLLEIAL
jgi:CRISPR-associated protein Csx3